MQERFWAKVDNSGECWLWTGAVNKGYGYFGRNGLPERLAHRWAWVFQFGPVPEGKEVCHHCDTPLCMRGSHLFAGTHRENMDDMVQKGRGRGGVASGEQNPYTAGERNGNCKLTDDQVAEIKSRYRKGLGGVLGREFGITSQHARALALGLTKR